MRKHTDSGRICREVVRKRKITEVVPGESCLKVSLRCVLNFPVSSGFIQAGGFGELSRKQPFCCCCSPVNPCPCYLEKEYIVKSAYLGGVAWTASLSRSPRPLGDSFTVQMTLRERSMEKLQKSKSNQINYERKSVLLGWGKTDLIPRRGLQRSRDGKCYRRVCGV